MEEGLLEEEKCIKDKKKCWIILLIITNILFLSIIITLVIIYNGKDKDEKKESSGNYSFTATYRSSGDYHSVQLINKLPHDGVRTCKLTKMTVDNEEVLPSLDYTFTY